MLLLCAAVALSAQKITTSNFWSNLQAGQSQKLLISGTSTSQAYSSDMHDGSSKSFVNWPILLKDALEEEFGSGKIDLIMATCAGVTSKVLMGEDPNKSHIGTKFIDYTVDAAADAVVMEWAIGADCADKFGISSSESKQYHIDAIDAIRAHPNTEIFLWTGAHSAGGKLDDRNGGDEVQADYAAMIRELAAEKNCYLIDTYDDFQALFEQMGESSYQSEYVPDGNHTSDKAANEIIIPEMLQCFQGYGPPPTFTVTSPKAGQKVAAGTDLTISWEWNADSLDAATELLISYDNGKNFSPIPGADGLDLTMPSYGTFTYAIPADVAETEEAVVKVQVYSSPKHALSPAFTIKPEGFVEVFDTLDNADTRVTVAGAWTPSSASSGYYGSEYIHDGNADKGTKTVTFTPDLPASGTYEVFYSYTAATNRASNVPVTINHANGSSTITVNEQIDMGGDFLSLGQFSFAAGQGDVTVSNEGTDGFVVVDALAFVLVNNSMTALDRAQIALPAKAAAHIQRIGLGAATRSIRVPAGARGLNLYSVAGRLVRRISIAAGARTVDLSRDVLRGGVYYARFDLR
jgi:hypothetical protein